MTRRQLPPQIKRVEVFDRTIGKSVVRYQLTCDAGIDPVSGTRRQVRRRYASEREARDALNEIATSATQGTFVPRTALTVKQACTDFVAAQHNLRETSRSKLGYDLAPLAERFGETPVQRVTKRDLDRLVTLLVAGGTTTAKGRTRRAWSAASVNKAIASWAMMFADLVQQGVLTRNPAEYVKHVPASTAAVDTYSEGEVLALLRAIDGTDRLAHAWELALSGLRRGEIAGLRWADVDFAGKTLAIANNRVSAGGKTVENDPKSAMSRRTLPLPDRLVTVLKAAKARQARERLALGGAGSWSYVVSNEAGEPFAPAVLSRYWRDAVKAAGIRHIKLHAARHTCATLMHLHGVPVSVIAAWIGHKDATLTMRLYVHSQHDALKSAGASLDRVVTPS
jgi:integrase